MQVGGGVRWIGRWRELAAQEHVRRSAREVGKIVLGVLIALGLGAVASEIGWQIEVRAARRALSPELGELIGQGDERVRVSRCVQRRLDRVADLLEVAARSGRLPPAAPIGAPPYRTWPRGVWDSTINAQTAAHFDREELDQYSSAYAFTVQIERAHMRELEVWTALHAVVGPGRPVPPEELARLHGAVSEARFLDRFVALNGLRMHQLADAYRLDYEQESVDDYRRPLPGYPICRRPGVDIPRRYGEAPLGGALDLAIANPITREDVGLGPSSPRR